MDSMPSLPTPALRPVGEVNFHASKYNKLLYGEGYLGWQPTPEGLYCRIITDQHAARLNEQDLAAMVHTLKRDAAIMAVRMVVTSLVVYVLISPEDYEALKRAGLEAKTAGSLAFADQALPEVPPQPYRWQSSGYAQPFETQVLSMADYRTMGNC